MSLMHDIRAFPVPANAVAMWWLGQSGYIFKSPGGLLVSTDLYLTNSCAPAYAGAGINLDRRVPVLIEPEELDVDVYTCTHNHLDHTDPETIGRLRLNKAWFAGPHPSCAVFREKGIDGSRIVPTWPDCRVEFGDVTLYGTFALPTDDTDLNHMGFVFEFARGPRVWITGDTDYCELLASAARYKPDVMITVINAGFNNLSHFEAALVAARVNPKIAIPCHYDLFPDNAADPEQFRAALTLRAPGVRYQRLEHGKPFVFSL